MKKHSLVIKQAGNLLPTLEKELPLLKAQALREALKRRDIKVNGQRVGGNISLRPGDSVEIFTPEEMRDIPLVYEDGDCLVVDKPAGVNTDPNHQSSFSLIAWAETRSQGQYTPFIVHRLDNATAGLVVLAKGEQARDTLEAMFKGKAVIKQYECLVKGCPQPPEAVKTAWLTKDAAHARVKVTDREKPGSKAIITQYKVLKAGAVSRLLVTLHTGRTHQIRAHLAHLGYPLLGDEAYGDRTLNRAQGARRLKLCATTLAFPEDALLDGLRGRQFHTNAPF